MSERAFHSSIRIDIQLWNSEKLGENQFTSDFLAKGSKLNYFLSHQLLTLNNETSYL